MSDQRFFAQLTQARELKRFLFEERVSFVRDELDAVNFGFLDQLKFHAYGRDPNPDEWSSLDIRFAALAAHLTPELRRKIRIYQLRVFFRTLPLVFLSFAILALTVSFIFTASFGLPQTADWYIRLPAFAAVVLWTIALGGLGACGFLGMTLISQSSTTNVVQGTTLTGPQVTNQTTVTEIDLTDVSFLTTRIVVGILFAFLLGIPFAYRALGTLIAPFNLDPTTNASEIDPAQIPRILIPFVTGFSTTLVLGIMDRFVSAIRSFFGIPVGR